MYGYCINLEGRIDRWKNIEKEYPKFVDRLERIEAVNTGDLMGCYLSHMKAITLGRTLNLSSMLVLEDDAIFVENARKIWTINLKDIPSDWDIVLGGVHWADYPKKIISKNIIQLNDFSATHCVLYNITDRLNILKDWERIPYDRYLGKLAKNNQLNIYCIVPFISIQYNNYSNLRKRITNDRYLFLNTEKKLKQYIQYKSSKKVTPELTENITIKNNQNKWFIISVAIILSIIILSIRLSCIYPNHYSV